MQDAYLRFREGFAEAMDARLYTIEYLDGLIAEGRAFLWWVNDSAIIAEIRHYPTGARAIHGLYATGNLDEIANLLIPAAEVWAKENGCNYAFIDSREAWQRVLKNKGYAHYKSALLKGL